MHSPWLSSGSTTLAPKGSSLPFTAINLQLCCGLFGEEEINTTIWENEEISPRTAVTIVIQNHAGWLLARPSLINYKQWLSHSASWQMVETTTQGRVKCNIDAAIFESEKCFGAGFCLRDDLGQFLIAKTAYQHGVPKPAVAAMSFIKFLLVLPLLFWMKVY